MRKPSNWPYIIQFTTPKIIFEDLFQWSVCIDVCILLDRDIVIKYKLSVECCLTTETNVTTSDDNKILHKNERKSIKSTNFFIHSKRTKFLLPLGGLGVLKATTYCAHNIKIYLYDACTNRGNKTKITIFTGI